MVHIAAPYRSSGADLPFGSLTPRHGVAMEGYFWRFTDRAARRVVIRRDAALSGGEYNFTGPDLRRRVVDSVLDETRGVPRRLDMPTVIRDVWVIRPQLPMSGCVLPPTVGYRPGRSAGRTWQRSAPGLNQPTGRSVRPIEGACCRRRLKTDPVSAVEPKDGKGSDFDRR